MWREIHLSNQPKSTSYPSSWSHRRSNCIYKTRTQGKNPGVLSIQRDRCSIKTAANQSCRQNLHPRHPRLHHWICNAHNQRYHRVSIPNLCIDNTSETHPQWPELQSTVQQIYIPEDILQRPWRLPPYDRSGRTILLRRTNPDNRNRRNLEIPTIALSHARMAPPQ